MTKPIYVLNGPNLNRLGTREPQIYGSTTLKQVEEMVRAEAGSQPIEFRQTNSETQLIDWVHEAIDNASGIIINPAAYTFTSLALLDALKMFPGPIIELHISNIHKRESSTSHRLSISLPVGPMSRRRSGHRHFVAMGHVWTAPGWQELSSRLQHWSVQPCVRPHMRALASSYFILTLLRFLHCGAVESIDQGGAPINAGLPCKPHIRRD